MILRTDEGKRMPLARKSNETAVSVKNQATQIHRGKAGLFGNSRMAAKDGNVRTARIVLTISGEINQ